MYISLRLLHYYANVFTLDVFLKDHGYSIIIFQYIYLHCNLKYTNNHYNHSWYWIQYQCVMSVYFSASILQHKKAQRYVSKATLVHLTQTLNHAKHKNT